MIKKFFLSRARSFEPATTQLIALRCILILLFHLHICPLGPVFSYLENLQNFLKTFIEKQNKSLQKIEYIFVRKLCGVWTPAQCIM